MVLVSGPQGDHFRRVWSLCSCHPIKGNSVLQFCTPKSRELRQLHWPSTHTQTQQFSGQQRDTTPKAGLRAVQGWLVSQHTDRALQAPAPPSPCSLHTWAQPGSCSCPGLLPSCCPSSAPDTCTLAVPTACASELPTNCWHIAGAAPLPSTNREQGMLHFPQAKNRELLYFPYMVRIKQKIVSKFGILQELSICLINIIIFTW